MNVVISGAPKTATTEDNVTKIYDLVLADRRLKIREIAETVGMSKNRVGHILHALAKAKLVELGYKLLHHPPYSPDLTPCDFFLFPNLKKSLAGQNFASNEEIVAATQAYFADLEKTYFLDGLKKLEHHWVKCIELIGDYVEK